MKRSLQYGDESGMALMTTLMVLMLASALMVGFFAAILADQRANGIDRDQTQAYAAAHAGLEKLTSDLATLFETDFNPTAAQINVLATRPPAIAGFSYIAPGGTAGSGYAIAFSNDGRGNPAPISATGTPITTGPYQGFNGIITQYTITSTARSTGGAEVRLRRLLETVAVPVFQFGVFSETDLSFFAGPNFNFGGRVHTNGNLYLEEGAGNTLTLSDRVTTAGEVIRRELSNGYSTRVNAPNYTGTVNVQTAPAVFRAMGLDEGSVKDAMGPPTSTYPLVLNELPTMNPGWTSISKGTYKSYIMSSRTGGKRLDLPLVSQGARPIDLIKRPVVNEPVLNPLVYTQRFYTMAALRILLSDTALDIMNLPGINAGTQPVPLDGTWTPAQYGPVDATHPPIARSPGANSFTNNGLVNVGSPVVINVNGVIPAFFVAPVLKVAGLPAVGGYTCTGRTPTTFTGCVGLLAALNGATVQADVPSGAGTTTVRTTLTAAVAVGNTTMNVVSTAGFAPGLFWANLLGGVAPLAITCTGNNNAQTQFTGCTGVTSNIPNVTTITTNALSNAGTSLINGFIKMELQNAAGNWVDVTTEILNLGIASRGQWPTGAGCAIGVDPNPNAVIRLQRLRDTADAAAGSCYYRNSQNSNDYWPNVLYDTREGNVRDSVAVGSDQLSIGGAMYYVELDVNNLRRWFAGTIGANGLNAVNQNGYIVYFSDRRNNRNTNVAVPAVETGEYGFADVVNPLDINGVPNGVQGGVPEAGEDLHVGTVGAGILDTYGALPVNVPNPPGVAPLSTAALSWNTVVGGVTVSAAHLMTNRPIFFRRALKLIHGGIGDTGVANQSAIPQPGFTVASENPVYIQGNYNASSAAITNAQQHFACAILSDAVTLLSTNWVDAISFFNPNDPSARSSGGIDTSYRVAIAAGKGLSFKQPVWNGAANDFGTDGGVHNFLRYLENWNSNLNYTGSIVSLFYNRQAVGTYKCCQNVYGPPTRVYNFDTDFLVPSLLPPGTPMFRDVNTLTFRQLLRPNQ